MAKTLTVCDSLEAQHITLRFALLSFGSKIMELTKPHPIVDAASAVLAESSVYELRQLRVDEDSNELRLHGDVRSFYHKQLAQEAVKTVAGDLRINNCLAVRAK